MTHLVDDGHGPTMFEHGFLSQAAPHLGRGWMSWAVPEHLGTGSYHLFSPTGEWSVAVHDFTTATDAVMEFTMPEYLSITWYDSIDVDQEQPRRGLRSDHLTGFYSQPGGWRALVRGQVPIRSIGVEVTPSFCARYLDREFGGQFAQVRNAFESIHVSGRDFPELRALLKGISPGAARSAMHYEGVVLQAMGMLVERTRQSHSLAAPTTAADAHRIRKVMAHIEEHYSDPLDLASLSRLACMGSTKFKESFRSVTGASLTRYIQATRMSRAEQLLGGDELSITQVAHAVGYRCASRFSELFRRHTSLLPSEYRKLRIAGLSARRGKDGVDSTSRSVR